MGTSEQSVINIDVLLKDAVYAGAIMLSSGAEIYRVEDTIIRMLSAAPNATVDAMATVTGIFACIETEEQELRTAIKRIKNRSTHLGKVALVNDLSRRFLSGSVPLESLFGELQAIENVKPYPAYTRVFFAGIGCACFSYMLGGNIASTFNALVIAWISCALVTFLSSRKVANVLAILAGSTLLTFLAVLFMRLGLNTMEYLDKAIIGALFHMVPGISITNAVRDILEGDLLSGTSRITDAFLVAVSIAAGVGFSLGIFYQYY